MSEDKSKLQVELDRSTLTHERTKCELELHIEKLEETKHELTNLKGTSMQMKLTKDMTNRKLADLQMRYDADKRKAELTNIKLADLQRRYDADKRRAEEGCSIM